ncbi:MAG TPA: hypothetical protein VF698_08065 [Thermoanaerobaculia bacterium]|jgi:hypothetical protein
MANQNPLDFDFDLRERAQMLGQAVAEHGPKALLDEVEMLLPDNVREGVRTFPMLAVAAGVGVGVWLGMRKSEDVIAAATTLISAAVMSNVSSAMDRGSGGSTDE